MQSVFASRDGGLVWNSEQDQIAYTSVSIKVDLLSSPPFQFQQNYFLKQLNFPFYLINLKNLPSKSSSTLLRAAILSAKLLLALGAGQA